MSELKPCPFCGGIARITEKHKNMKGYDEVLFGRITCENNHRFQNPEIRCFIKTVCAPLNEVIRSWNTRKVYEEEERRG